MYVKWHLEELRSQVRRYLAHLDEKRAWEEQCKTLELPGSTAFSDGPQEVEPPEALVLLWTCRAVGGMWEAGGVGDQPHLLMNEFLTVQRVEAEYQAELARNREMLDALRART
jgi:hypothetical protein